MASASVLPFFRRGDFADINAQHGVPRVSSAGAKTDQTRQDELQEIKVYQELVELVNLKV